ncbi:uncharacterized protein EV422DRAFT_509764 [Fimicolochytrium jonesii]|uniref:uncharacterized protein n=1 Tax=Fimicolochytrium jonesii TaxID=1396493 RepID=UPI0022FE5089|nr:uncharacterized protein EV422DRAFT_509764 [Fimicolochytrium jonesii]KAI8816536.1 hypothetical protein EV422DRAFT_509764 [Fimicolochytrium jonesii]
MKDTQKDEGSEELPLFYISFSREDGSQKCSRLEVRKQHGRGLETGVVAQNGNSGSPKRKKLPPFGLFPVSLDCLEWPCQDEADFPTERDFRIESVMPKKGTRHASFARVGDRNPVLNPPESQETNASSRNGDKPNYETGSGLQDANMCLGARREVAALAPKHRAASRSGKFGNAMQNGDVYSWKLLRDKHKRVDIPSRHENITSPNKQAPPVTLISRPHRSTLSLEGDEARMLGGAGLGLDFGTGVGVYVDVGVDLGWMRIVLWPEEVEADFRNVTLDAICKWKMDAVNRLVCRMCTVRMLRLRRAVRRTGAICGHLTLNWDAKGDFQDWGDAVPIRTIGTSRTLFRHSGSGEETYRP